MPISTKPRRKYTAKAPKQKLGAWDQARAIQQESRNLLSVVPSIGRAIREKMESGEAYDRATLTELASLFTKDVELYRKEMDTLDGLLAAKSGDFSDGDDLATALELAMQYSNWNERWAMVVIPTITEILSICTLTGIVAETVQTEEMEGASE
jgi:hypothetical protein